MYISMRGAIGNTLYQLIYSYRLSDWYVYRIRYDWWAVTSPLVINFLWSCGGQEAIPYASTEEHL